MLSRHRPNPTPLFLYRILRFYAELLFILQISPNDNFTIYYLGNIQDETNIPIIKQMYNAIALRNIIIKNLLYIKYCIDTISKKHVFTVSDLVQDFTFDANNINTITDIVRNMSPQSNDKTTILNCSIEFLKHLEKEKLQHGTSKWNHITILRIESQHYMCSITDVLGQTQLIAKCIWKMLSEIFKDVRLDKRLKGGMPLGPQLIPVAEACVGQLCQIGITPQAVAAGGLAAGGGIAVAGAVLGTAEVVAYTAVAEGTALAVVESSITGGLGVYVTPGMLVNAGAVPSTGGYVAGVAAKTLAGGKTLAAWVGGVAQTTVVITPFGWACLGVAALVTTGALVYFYVNSNSETVMIPQDVPEHQRNEILKNKGTNKAEEKLKEAQKKQAEASKNAKESKTATEIWRAKNLKHKAAAEAAAKKAKEAEEQGNEESRQQLKREEEAHKRAEELAKKAAEESEKQQKEQEKAEKEAKEEAERIKKEVAEKLAKAIKEFKDRMAAEVVEENSQQPDTTYRRRYLPTVELNAVGTIGGIPRAIAPPPRIFHEVTMPTGPPLSLQDILNSNGVGKTEAQFHRQIGSSNYSITRAYDDISKSLRVAGSIAGACLLLYGLLRYGVRPRPYNTTHQSKTTRARALQERAQERAKTTEDDRRRNNTRNTGGSRKKMKKSIKKRKNTYKKYNKL